MTDGYGRKIKYARISVTDRCNLRCTYCMPTGLSCKKRHEDIASLEELAGLARAAADCGVTKFRITGGEPLVRKNVLWLCSAIKKIPGVEELAVTTNGVLLPTMASQLRAAGVDRLNVSLDTLDPAKYRKLTGGELDQVLDGLNAAEKAGFTGTKINVVLQKGVNDEEIRRLAALAGGAVRQVRFIELMPIGTAAPLMKERYLPAEYVLEQMPELIPDGVGGVSELYRIPGMPGQVGLIRPLSHKFCTRCDRIRITADGKVKPCLCSGAEYDLRGLPRHEAAQKLAEVIREKPQGHHLQRRSETGRTMNEIGG